jgi:hypothetical protein
MVTSPKGLGPENDCAGSNYKRETSPLARESSPHQQTRNCLTVIKMWSWAPGGCFIPRQTGRLTVGRNIRLRLSLVGCETFASRSVTRKLLVKTNCSVVRRRVHVLARVLYLLVVTIWRYSVNPVTNPNPVYRQTQIRTYMGLTHWVTSIVGIDGEGITCSWHLTPLNRIFLQKVLVAQLVNIFSPFYVTRRFINMFISFTTGPYPEAIQTP